MLFPAHAGMNRSAVQPGRRSHSVPRTRGDEPLVRDALSDDPDCSPHTRG